MSKGQLTNEYIKFIAIDATTLVKATATENTLTFAGNLDGDELFEKIEKLFIITNDSTDKMTCEEAHKIIIDSGIIIDIGKITVFLDRMGVKKSYTSNKCRMFRRIKSA